MLTAVTGINWGDEGKGRVIDLLAENADVVVRYQGGNNAGHTVVTNNCKFVLNLLPSGILHPDVTCVLGDGMVVDLDHLENEIESIREKGIVISPQNLKLSKHATISMPWHKIQDELEEDRLAKTGSAFGSTRRGIAYAYSDKYKRQTGQWTQEDEAGYQLYRQETDPKKRTFRVWYLIANPRGLPKEFVQKELEFRWKLFPEKKEEPK